MVGAGLALGGCRGPGPGAYGSGGDQLAGLPLRALSLLAFNLLDVSHRAFFVDGSKENPASQEACRARGIRGIGFQCSNGLCMKGFDSFPFDLTGGK